MNEMMVTLNGEARRITGVETVEQLLGQLGLDPRAVVVEVNRRIVRKEQVKTTALANGDSIELVHFVGGG
jgi:thiamine biosynthesis protein ThiS